MGMPPPVHNVVGMSRLFSYRALAGSHAHFFCGFACALPTDQRLSSDGVCRGGCRTPGPPIARKPTCASKKPRPLKCEEIPLWIQIPCCLPILHQIDHLQGRRREIGLPSQVGVRHVLPTRPATDMSSERGDVGGHLPELVAHIGCQGGPAQEVRPEPIQEVTLEDKVVDDSLALLARTITLKVAERNALPGWCCQETQCQCRVQPLKAV